MAERPGDPTTQLHGIDDAPTKVNLRSHAEQSSSVPRSYAAQRVERSRSGRKWLAVGMAGIALGGGVGVSYVFLSGKSQGEVRVSPSTDTETEQTTQPNLPSSPSVPTTGRTAIEAASQQINKAVAPAETKVTNKAAATGDSTVAATATSQLKHNIVPVPATQQGGARAPKPKPKRLQTADNSVNTTDLPPGTGTAPTPDITTMSGPEPMTLAPRPCTPGELYWSGHGDLPVADGQNGTPEQQAQFAMGKQIGQNTTCP